MSLFQLNRPLAAAESVLSSAVPKRRTGLRWRLLGNRMVLVGSLLLSVLVLSTLLAPLLAPHDPLDQETSRRLMPPMWAGGSPSFPLGTDPVGRDVLSRILFGGRISLSLGLASVTLSGLMGVSLGLLAGFYGKALDELLMRLADVQLAFPTILLAIAIIAVIGRSTIGLVAVLTLTGWVLYARTVRASVLSLKEKEFVLAARAIGASDGRILVHHILPNCLAPVLVVATVQMGTLILLESGLSFFGLGTQPPQPSWGGMLAEGRNYLLSGAWWLTTFPGLALSLTVLAINLLGDGLRDVLDPRLKHRQ